MDRIRNHYFLKTAINFEQLILPRTNYSYELGIPNIWDTVSQLKLINSNFRVL